MEDRRVTNQCDLCPQTAEVKPRKDGAPKLAMGWKRHGGKVYCPKCWKARFVTRAVTVPIVKPVDGEWAAFGRAIDELSYQSAAIANLTVAHWHAIDTAAYTPAPPAKKGTKTKVKLPPFPEVNIYQLARERFPNYPTSSLVALQQAARGKYMKDRWELLVRRTKSLPNFRTPMPIPLKATSITIEREDKKGVIISARLLDRRWSFILKGGRDYARQNAAITKVLRGEARHGEVSLQRARDGKRVLCKVVVQLPIESRRNAEGLLFVARPQSSLLVARLGRHDRNGWWLHGDQLRRWQAAHRARLRRLGEDIKGEPRGRWHRKDDLKDQWFGKHKRRVDTFIHQATASLARHAERHNVAGVVLDETDRGYIRHFPWYIFKERLAQKLKERGIVLVTLADHIRALEAEKQQNLAADAKARIEAMLTENDGTNPPTQETDDDE